MKFQTSIPSNSIELVTMDFLLYDALRKVLFCMRCKHGINHEVDKIEHHLRDAHKEIDFKTRKVLAQVECMGAMNMDDKDAVRAAQSFGHIAGLDHYNGWSCSSCGGVGRETSTWPQHKAIHKDDDVQMEACFVQTIFLGGRKSYFAVQPPVTTSNMRGLEDKLNIRIRQHKQEQRNQGLVAPEVVSSLQLTKWDAKTRWATFHKGTMMLDLAKYSIVHHDDDSPAVHHVVKAITRLLARVHAKLQDFPDHHLRIFQSIGHELSGKPFKNVGEQTFVTYQRAWQKLLGFLVRTQGHNVPGLTVSDEQARLLLKLCGGRFEERGADREEELLGLIQELSMSLISQEITQNEFTSPIVFWLSVEGYHVTQGRWKKAWEFRPTLSQIVYCMRLVVIEEWRRDEVGMSTHTARNYAKEYLHDGCDAAFTVIHGIRAYAKVAGEDYYGNPSTTWTKDGTALILKGKIFTLDGLRGMVAGWVRTIGQQIESGLLFQSTGWLESVELTSFEDNPLWAAGGECFVDQGEGVLTPWPEVCERAERSAVGQALIDEMRSAVGGRQVFSELLLHLVRCGC